MYIPGQRAHAVELLGVPHGHEGVHGPRGEVAAVGLKFDANAVAGVGVDGMGQVHFGVTGKERVKHIF